MCKQSSVTIPGFPPLKKPSALTKTPNYKYCSFDYLTHTWLFTPNGYICSYGK